MVKAKPAAAKGKYVQSVTICSTMGPGVHLDVTPYNAEGGLRRSNMKKKPEKQKDMEALREELAKAQNVFLTGYEKLTVSQDFELRKTIRGAGASYKVIKNRIAEKAAEGTQPADLLKDLKGMCSIAYTSGDPVALAKALTVYAKANPSFHVQGGNGGGPGGRRLRHSGAGDPASEGRDLREVPVPDQRAGATAGDGDERSGPEPGRGGRSGRQRKQVFRS